MEGARAVQRKGDICERGNDQVEGEEDQVIQMQQIEMASISIRRDVLGKAIMFLALLGVSI